METKSPILDIKIHNIALGKKKVLEAVEASGGPDAFMHLIEDMYCTGELACDIGWEIGYSDRSRYAVPDSIFRGGTL